MDSGGGFAVGEHRARVLQPSAAGRSSRHLRPSKNADKRSERDEKRISASSLQLPEESLECFLCGSANHSILSCPQCVCTARVICTALEKSTQPVKLFGDALRDNEIPNARQL